MTAARDHSAPAHPHETAAPANRPAATPASTGTWVARPGSMGEAFVGRGSDLLAVSEAFKEHRAVVIGGGDGVGKTRLAAEHAHRSEAAGFWTAAGATADETLAALAPLLHVPPRGMPDAKIAERVRQLLRGFTADILWVVDDLPEARQLEELMERADPVRILVTTRDARQETVPPGAAWVELEALDPEAAVQLLSGNAEKQGDRKGLAEIAGHVGYLPLPLELLARRLGDSGVSPGKLSRQLSKTPDAEEWAAYRAAAESGRVAAVDGVAAAMREAFEALPKGARSHLVPLAYLASTPIPDALISAVCGLTAEERSLLVETCGRRSMLSRQPAGVSLHVLTASAIRSLVERGGGRSGSRDALKSLASRAQRRLAVINRSDPDTLRLEIAHHQAIFEHLRDASEDRFGLLRDFAEQVAVALETLDRGEAALLLREECLEIIERTLGADDPGTLAARTNLAHKYESLGRPRQAVAAHKRTLAAQERTLGEEHPATLRSRERLAASYRAAGQPAEALRIYERTVRIKERVLGPRDPSTLTSRNNLATAQHALGNAHDAVPIYERTLEVRERVLGHEHPYTLATRANLAAARHTTGQLYDALPLYEETLRLRAKTLGPDHPSTLISQNNLAAAYQADGRLGEAAPLFEQTLLASERTLGPEHPATLTARNNLASAYRAAGRLSAAAAMYERTLEARERVLGPDHPNTLTTRNNLATAHAEAGRLMEAIIALEETLRASQRVLGDDHPATLTVRANLATAYRAAGQDAEARELMDGTGLTMGFLQHVPR